MDDLGFQQGIVKKIKCDGLAWQGVRDQAGRLVEMPTEAKCALTGRWAR